MSDVKFSIKDKTYQLESMEECMFYFASSSLRAEPILQKVKLLFTIQDDYEEGLEALIDTVVSKDEICDFVITHNKRTMDISKFSGKPIMWGTSFSSTHNCEVEIKIY